MMKIVMETRKRVPTEKKETNETKNVIIDDPHFPDEYSNYPCSIQTNRTRCSIF
jgi:hypothetical protein